MEIDVRRVQRVGTSSLVVTLPKEWARRHNLAPGSQVMLVDEGDSIKIMPVSRTKDAAMELDLSKLPEKLAVSTPLCIYLSPASEAEVAFPSRKALADAKQRSLNLMGLQIFDTPEGERARIEVLLDPSRIDISKLLKTLTVSVRETVELLVKVLRGEGDGVEEKVELVRTQFLRTHYIVLRYLAAKYTRKGGLENYQVTLSTSYAGFAIDLLQELILTAKRLTLNGVDGEDLESLINIARGIEVSGDLLFRTLANPSVKRLVELQGELMKTRALSEQLMLGAKSKAAAVIAGKLHDITRLMIISSYVAVCRVIAGLASNKK